jgi:hypothetical protein
MTVNYNRKRKKAEKEKQKAFVKGKSKTEREEISELCFAENLEGLRESFITADAFSPEKVTESSSSSWLRAGKVVIMLD